MKKIIFLFFFSIYFLEASIPKMIQESVFGCASIPQFLNHFRYNDQLGGKASSLLRLEQVPGVNVPRWICLGSELFEQFLAEHHFDKDSESIREHILQTPFSLELLGKIRAACQQLKGPLAVRSSCSAEDQRESSYAGLYDTFLHQQTFDQIVWAIRSCWASAFNDRAIVARKQLGIANQAAHMAVILQEMVEARAAGTSFSREVSTGYPGIEIAANFGLGEGVVGGEICVDQWLVLPSSKKILKMTRGDKKFKFVSTDGGIDKVITSQHEREEMALSSDQIREIAIMTMRIRNHYGCDIDTEFAIDCDGTLYFLQARPLIEIAKGFTTVDLEQVPAAKVIARGYFSVPGAVSGTIKFIPSWDDLVSGNIKIEADDIVLTYLSTNYWTQYMTQFKGMITQEGGPTSHPMILCRERNVPCVIGIPNDFERLIALNGQRVTLDGMQKLIYLDDLPIKKASPSDCEQLFEPIEFLPLPSYEQIKADLKTYQMLFEEDGEGWVITPSYRMGKLLQEINLKRYEQRAKLVGVPYWPVEAKVIDGYVCDKLFSFEENLAYFSHMDLEASEAFHRKQERAIEDYLCLTRQFAFTVDHWDRYVELTSEIRAYIWLGLFYRAHIEQHIAALAQREKIPRIVQEAYATRFQSRLFSEDQAMQRDLALTSPDDPESLISLGKKYRFSKNVSFEQEFDLELVKQRVLTATPYEQEPTPLDQEIYFPDFPEFRRWVELAVNNRVLQSDFHHKQIRGQWPVREKLLELGARFFPQPEEIFNCSVAEVRELILRLAIPPMGKVKIGNV